MRLLIVGAAGMLGNALVRYFGPAEGVAVFGTARSGIPAGYAERLSTVTIFPYPELID